MRVIVLGAGVVGSATALALASRGAEVVLIERAAEAAAETSHANGAGITPGHAEPWNTPGIWRQFLPGLGRTDASFRIYPAALPGLSGWGLRFLLNSRPGRYFTNARHNTRLAVYSAACLRRWRQDFSLEYEQCTRGSLELYFDQAELDHARRLRETIGNPKIELRQITAASAVEMEPALEPVAGRIRGVLHFPDHESGDACRFAQTVAERAGKTGARLLFDTEVRRIECAGGRFSSVTTDRETLPADACVVAAGCSSPALLKPLGLKLPIYPVKGYSLTVNLDGAEGAPRLPLLDLERRIITARFGENTLRVAGLADFAGHDYAIHPDRAGYLLDAASALLPRLEPLLKSGAPELWTGLRPMTPDGPPLLGPAGPEGIFLNTGHGSMGWTQACGSAEIVADLVTGREPAIELTGLVAARWLRG